MALWDHFLGKGSSGSSKELNPIIQVNPRPEIYSTSTETPVPTTATPLPAGVQDDVMQPTKVDRSGPVRPKGKGGSRTRRFEAPRQSFLPPPGPVRKPKPAPMMPRYMLPTEPERKPAAAPPPPPMPKAAEPRKAQIRDSLTLLRQGVIFQGRGDHQGAVDALTKAIELDPSSGDAYEARGVSREKLGDTEGARKDYEKAIGMEVNAEIERQARENGNISTQ